MLSTPVSCSFREARHTAALNESGILLIKDKGGLGHSDVLGLQDLMDGGVSDERSRATGSSMDGKPLLGRAWGWAQMVS